MAADRMSVVATGDSQSEPRGRDRLIYLLSLVALACVYYLTARLSLQFASRHPSATPVWLPTGIALASLVLGGRRLWPAVLAGAFLANLSTPESAGMAAGIAVGNTLEALLGAHLAERYARGARAMDRPSTILRWVGLAAVLATAVSATIGVLTLRIGGSLTGENLWPVWLTWWLGDAGGALVVAPFLIIWARDPRPAWDVRQAVEILLLGGLLWALGEACFGVPFGISPHRIPIAFVFPPLLAWAAFRLDARVTATLALAVGAVAVGGTLQRQGPFAVGDRNTSLLIVQGFLSVSTTTALVVAAAVRERREAQRDLAALNADLERRVEERTASLKEMVGELDTFAYTVAHDLRAPLRAVHRFGEILLEEHAPKLDAEGRGCVVRMMEGAARMDALIDALLSYSRVARADIELVPVDADGLISTIAEQCGGEIRDLGGSLRIEKPLPILLADPVLLSQCLTNLLTNSIKFVEKGKAPEITVGAERRGDRVRLKVRDRGIGISAEHRDRIFRIFERLNPAGSYPGTGVGLAIVKKAVERMNGQVGVDSEAGNGALFWIDLRSAGP